MCLCRSFIRGTYRSSPDGGADPYLSDTIEHPGRCIIISAGQVPSWAPLLQEGASCRSRYTFRHPMASQAAKAHLRKWMKFRTEGIPGSPCVGSSTTVRTREVRPGTSLRNPVPTHPGWLVPALTLPFSTAATTVDALAVRGCITMRGSVDVSPPHPPSRGNSVVTDIDLAATDIDSRVRNTARPCSRI